MLCPGFFSCPELIEETAQALKAVLSRPRAAGFGTCRRLLAEGGEGGEDGEGSERSESSLRLEGLQRQNSLGSQVRSRDIVSIAAASITIDVWS